MTTHTIVRRGDPERFESDLTISEALAIMAAAPSLSDFARSLLDKAREGRPLSELQVAWVHRIALDLRDRAPTGINLRPVLEMLLRARDAQKRLPCITLRDGDNATVRITLARDGVHAWVRSPATRNVPARLRARIAPDGSVTTYDARFRTTLAPVLEALAADPTVVAAQHGVATGMCSFCGRPLSDARSREVGYGPLCADRFGLPWGARDGVDQQHSAALAAGETLAGGGHGAGRG